MTGLPDSLQVKRSGGVKPAASDKQYFRSEDLFRGGREIVIEHGREKYRLLITKSGKLILNK